MWGAISCGERKVPASGLQVQVSRVKKTGPDQRGRGVPYFFEVLTGPIPEKSSSQRLSRKR